MLPANLKKFYDDPIRVLDHGSIQLIDVMGDEQAIIDAARVSYGSGTKRVSEDRALIRYLMRMKHTSPFEMCEIKLRIHIPMDCWRQYVRHRTASLNEVSTRYSVVDDQNQSTRYDQWRLQALDNKQGSAGFLIDQWPAEYNVRPVRVGVDDDVDADGVWLGQEFFTSPGEYLSEKETEFHKAAHALYNERLKFGVAREQARKDLPLSTYTTAYWKIDLHNLLHFLRLRLDSHAQLEIRQYAEAIAKIVKVWVPAVWEAFEDYTLLSTTFNKLELLALSRVLGGIQSGTGSDIKSVLLEVSGLKGREQLEFGAKITKLMGVEE